MLCLLYGEDYEAVLGDPSGCILFEKDSPKKQYMRLGALSLVLTNLVMAVVLFPVKSLLVFLTNWGAILTAVMLITLICLS